MDNVHLDFPHMISWITDVQMVSAGLQIEF